MPMPMPILLPLLSAALTLALAFAVAAPAAAAPLAAPAPAPATASAATEQRWLGRITTGEGPADKVEFRVRFTGALATRTGFISIPAQNIRDLPLSDLSVFDTKLRFTLLPAGSPVELASRFELDTQDWDRREASGTVITRGQGLPVAMRQLAPNEFDQFGPKRPQTPIAPLPYPTREITVIVTPAVTLAGTLALPDPAKFPPPYTTAIFITGSGPQDRDETLFDHQPFFVIADALAKAGIASLRCDDRGVGKSTGGSPAETSDDFAKDVTAQMLLLATLPEIDPKRIGLIGHSEGAIIAPLVAQAAAKAKAARNAAAEAASPRNAEMAEALAKASPLAQTATPGNITTPAAPAPLGAPAPDIAFAVLIAAPGVSGESILLQQQRAILLASGAPADFVEKLAAKQQLVMAAAARADRPAIIAAMREMATLQLGIESLETLREGQLAALEATLSQQADGLLAPWMQRFLSLDPAEPLRSLTCPVLVLAGSRDTQVPTALNIGPLMAALTEQAPPRAADVTLHVLPGLNHLMQESQTGAPTEYAQIEQTISPRALEIIVRWMAQR